MLLVATNDEMEVQCVQMIAITRWFCEVGGALDLSKLFGVVVLMSMCAPDRDSMCKESFLERMMRAVHVKAIVYMTI